MILDDLRYFHDNPFPSKLRNMQKWEIIKKKHIQILKIELETRNDFLAAETYSFSLKNTWFQNIDYFFKLTSDDPSPSRNIYHDICLWKKYSVLLVFSKMTKFSISSTFLSWNVAKIKQNVSLVEGAEQRSFLITWCI